MKKIILVVMVLLGANICNAQKVKTTPVKTLPGQMPPQARPKQPAPQMVQSTGTGSTKNKVDSSKSKLRRPTPPSLGIEKELQTYYPYRPDTPRKPRFPWRD